MLAIGTIAVGFFAGIVAHELLGVVDSRAARR